MVFNIFIRALFLLLITFGSTVTAAASANQPDFIGRKVCGSCHAEQLKLWTGSYHDLALQKANEETVLGNFTNATFTHFGISTTFYRKDDKFMVTTDGPDGKLQDYAIKYTFGVYPLQQYMIEFPGGRLQVLDIAWDSRPKQQGGQRWFHLHPEEPIRAGDVLHWTGRNLNWNYMCADCHSTNLRKNYDAKTDSYNTTWSEINVSCEACHGPGSEHVEWANKYQSGKAKPNDKMGLTVTLNERKGVHWKIDQETGKPHRSIKRTTSNEIEVCARCHSRRSQLTDKHIAGQPFMDGYRPSLLLQGLYHANGQMQDEVYVYGSFLQSRMHQAGVTCSDCHEPHSTKLKSEGEQVCLQCHAADRYASKQHHFHQQDNKGASCIECHMPPTTFMGVDERHDHSFRIPRPDYSVKYSTPNACNNCHQDKDARWAAEQVQKWYGKTPTGLQQFAPALYADWHQLPGAKDLLTALERDSRQPSIIRASALVHLGSYPDRNTYEALKRGLEDPDPMLRLAALDAVSVLDAQQRVVLVFPMLKDPVRAVRISAARELASVPIGRLPNAERNWLQRALQEYIDVQHFNADRPESHFNLGALYTEQGEVEQAETAYRKALQLNPQFVPAYVGYAQLLGQMGRGQEGDKLLHQGIEHVPDNADLYAALGLSLVRQKRANESVPMFAQAVRLAPEVPRYTYIYGVALNSTGSQKQAIEVMQAGHEQHPGNTDILYGLVTFLRDAGRKQEALKYARELQRLRPNNPAIQQLVIELAGNS